ncbi:MAG: cell division protein FtsZ [Chloroflexota bacterium]
MAKQSLVPNPAKIKVIGAGGGGCNSITRMVREDIKGVEFIAMNTDAQALALVEAPVRFQLGEKLTKGLGCGGDHHVGQKAAEENRDELRELLSGADMVFVTCGMGGGTGTGSIPVIAEIAKKCGALTIGIVTKPFSFEGSRRMRTAEEGIVGLLTKVDTLIIIPNDRLLSLCDQKTGVENAFRLADSVLYNGVKAISEVITLPGIINLDFADVRAIMKDAGPAWMSIGIGSGKDRAVNAAKEALASPLLEVSIKGARGVLLNVVGGESLTLQEVNEAAQVVRDTVSQDANIIFGVVHDSSMANDVKITLIATGFTQMGASDTESMEQDKILRALKTEDELDVPSFMRHPMFSHRRQIPNSTQVETGSPVKIRTP